MKNLIIIIVLAFPIASVAQFGYGVATTTFKTDLIESNWEEMSLGDYKGISFQTNYKFDQIIINASADFILSSEEPYSEIFAKPILSYYRMGVHGITQIGIFDILPSLKLGYYTSPYEESIAMISNNEILMKTIARHMGFSIGGEIIYPVHRIIQNKYLNRSCFFIGFNYNILFNSKSSIGNPDPVDIDGYNFMTIDFGLKYWLKNKTGE